ncbi:MAG: methylmalonyl-CoA epimerase [Candidatus Thorarchaeota archaeon]|nr:MAG: methylmalonyl-CoA epimerase [Candidatus Thorarchaeota archaeon]
MIEKIEHIGIAVERIEELISYYRDVLGLEYRGEEIVEEQKVRVAFFEIGESSIELLEPTSDDSPIAKFLAKRGPGIHHVAVRVDNIDQALKQHEANGAQMIDKEPRFGAHNMRIAFVHPRSTGGVLVELCQKSE